VTRFADHGEETVIAVCNIDDIAIDAISHDFAQAQFTDLGDYEQHIQDVVRTRAIAVEAAAAAGQPGASAVASASASARAAIQLQVQ